MYALNSGECRQGRNTVGNCTFPTDPDSHRRDVSGTGIRIAEGKAIEGKTQFCHACQNWFHHVPSILYRKLRGAFPCVGKAFQETRIQHHDDKMCPGRCQRQ